MNAYVSSSPCAPHPEGSREALAQGKSVLDADAAAHAALHPLEAQPR
jgi:hypothetical protein